MSRLKWLWDWFKRWMRYQATWRAHRAIIKELNGMTDKDLADMGISRYDIDRLVWQPEDFERRGGKDVGIH